jgi:hypothetical protein
VSGVVTEARGAEAPRAPNQGAPARRPIDIVAFQCRPWKVRPRRFVEGEPFPGRIIDGRTVVGWSRTDTGPTGIRRGFGCVMTDLTVDYTDGSTDYVTCITKEAL